MKSIASDQINETTNLFVILIYPTQFQKKITIKVGSAI